MTIGCPSGHGVIIRISSHLPNRSKVRGRPRGAAQGAAQARQLLRQSDTFPDAEKLLAALDERGLEGIVSKKTDQPYVSGKNRGWIKVKCHSWRLANQKRGELFARK